MGFGFFLMENREMIGCRLICLLAVALFCQRIRIFLFFGFVEISDDSGDFEETSSREGLLNNEAMVQLQNFLCRSILNSVVKIAENRNIKIVSGQKRDEKGNWEKIEIRVKNIAHTLDELDKALEEGEPSLIARRKRKQQLKKVKAELDEVAKLQKIESARLFKE